MIGQPSSLEFCGAKRCHHILKSTSHSLYAELTELLIINNFKEYVGF